MAFRPRTDVSANTTDKITLDSVVRGPPPPWTFTSLIRPFFFLSLSFLYQTRTSRQKLGHPWWNSQKEAIRVTHPRPFTAVRCLCHPPGLRLEQKLGSSTFGGSWLWLRCPVPTLKPTRSFPVCDFNTVGPYIMMFSFTSSFYGFCNCFFYTVIYLGWNFWQYIHSGSSWNNHSFENDSDSIEKPLHCLKFSIQTLDLGPHSCLDSSLCVLFFLWFFLSLV